MGVGVGNDWESDCGWWMRIDRRGCWLFVALGNLRVQEGGPAIPEWKDSERGGLEEP